MNKLEKALENIANGAEVAVGFEQLDLESVRRLMAGCSAATSNVTMLTLSWCGLDAQAAEVIASSLRSDVVLAFLNLGCNKTLGPLGAQALGEMLYVNTSLKTLKLYRCDVGDEGAGHSAVALRQNRTLKGLDLDNNGITQVGAAALAAALPFNQTLKRLDKRRNLLGDVGLEALARAVPRSGLRILWLRETQFGERGHAALVEMLKNGSRLRKLVTDSHLWPALEEGFCCNGWLLDGAPAQYLERNKAMHVRARKSVFTLLLMSSFPKEVVREIAQFVYSSRGEISVWRVNEQ
jgi:hypothetical protein